MNETALTVLLEKSEMIRTGREMSLVNFSRQSMNMDRSRPVEPGSFRYSLEAMQRDSAEMSRPPSSPRLSVRDHDDARTVSRRPEKQNSVQKASDRRQHKFEKLDRRSRRPDESRERATAQHAEHKPKPDRTGDAEKVKSEASRSDEPDEQGTPVASEDAVDQEQALTAATTVPIEEAPVKATGSGGQATSVGTPVQTISPEDSTFQVLPESAADGGETESPEETGKQVNGQADTGSGNAAKVKNSITPGPHKGSGKPAKDPGKSSVTTPLPVDTAEEKPLAEPVTKQMAVPSPKGAASDNTFGPAILQPPPAIGSQEAAALSARTGEGLPTSLEEASKGRVVQIGSDSQSGQTGLFSGTHSPPGTAQGVGATAASDAPAYPFQHELLQQVTEKTVFFLKNGKSQARIDLKPELLGHMRLHVSTDHGQVTLKIMTESAWVRDIVESNINHLRNELQNHNLQIDRLDVSVSGGGQDFADGNAQTANSRLTSSASTPAGKDEPMPSPDGQDSRRLPAEGERVGLVDYFA